MPKGGLACRLLRGLLGLHVLAVRPCPVSPSSCCYSYVLRSSNESRSSALGRGEVQAVLAVPKNRTSPTGLQH